jgi:hypothetical protein
METTRAAADRLHPAGVAAVGRPTFEDLRNALPGDPMATADGVVLRHVPT